MRRWSVRLGLGAVLLGGAIAAAEEATFPAGGIAEALTARIGKPVTLVLDSGTEIGGTVAEVRGATVVLRALAGKDFYDALVVLDDVAAVQVRRAP
jgi:hypothetical protein